MITEKQRMRMWSAYDAEGMLTPCADGGELPFGMLPEEERLTSCRWFVLSVWPQRGKGSAAFIRSHELGDLLYFYTGVSLTDNQVQESLMLLGIESWGINGEDCVYRISRDCPCASIALDGEGGIKRIDRSCHVGGSLKPLSNR